MMNGDDTSSITYQAALPLAWRGEDAPHVSTLVLWRHANLALLRALATIESVTPADKDHDADHHVAKALDRLEAKLDVALELIARLTAQQTALPPPMSVTLGTSQLVWEAPAGTAPSSGSEVKLMLYLSPRLPEPLQLWARIVTEPVSADTVRCTGQFIDRDEEFDEWMTRTLFRYHRRALQARHQD